MRITPTMPTNKIDEGKPIVPFTLNNRPITGNRIKQWYIMFLVRQGRGSGLIQQLRIDQMAIISTALKVFIPDIPFFLIPFGAVVFMSMTYMFGLFDEKKLKLWQMENERDIVHANPYVQRMERGMIRLQKHMKIDMKGDDIVTHTGK